MASDRYEEWDKLCQEFHEARDAQNAVLARVTAAFRAIAEGTSRQNPSDEDIAELEEAKERLDAVQNKMDKFVRDNT
jgi:hypothetical protein